MLLSETLDSRMEQSVPLKCSGMVGARWFTSSFFEHLPVLLVVWSWSETDKTESESSLGCSVCFYTEQMDAEGLAPSEDPRRAPEKQTVGAGTASHKMPTLQALSSSLNAGTSKRGCLCPPKRLDSHPHFPHVPRFGRQHRLNFPRFRVADFLRPLLRWAKSLIANR